MLKGFWENGTLNLLRAGNEVETKQIRMRAFYLLLLSLPVSCTLPIPRSRSFYFGIYNYNTSAAVG
jgi:hypothetical protein